MMMEVTASVKFTADAEDGTVDVIFEFSGVKTAGKKIVAFETLEYKGKEYAVHADINDNDQTVLIPKVSTTASDKNNGTHMSYAGKDVTIVDKVEVKNIVAGREYTLKGKVMDKKTGNPLLVDGKEITAEKTFKANGENETVELEFTFDASALKGTTTVVFENLYEGENEIGTHADLEDENDDLWEKIYEKLVRLSHLYTHKNLEISEEKDKLKELVSDISHQTKTPIANIKLYLEIMTDESDFKKNQEYIRKMNGQIDKLDFLLQSMVKMSRLETGTIKIQKQNVLLADTLAMAISNVVIKADKKNIKIDVQYDEQLMLKHDKKWTAEAIFNILDNAVKYTEVGGNIHVVVCRQELFTKISIEDTGKGIAPERQATIFTRFYREPEVHDKEGIGIGLYLAREIITLQNGYIEVQSQIGQGSKFIIYLPNRD